MVIIVKVITFPDRKYPEYTFVKWSVSMGTEWLGVLGI